MRVTPLPAPHKARGFRICRSTTTPDATLLHSSLQPTPPHVLRIVHNIRRYLHTRSSSYYGSYKPVPTPLSTYIYTAVATRERVGTSLFSLLLRSGVMCSELTRWIDLIPKHDERIRSKFTKVPEYTVDIYNLHTPRFLLL